MGATELVEVGLNAPRLRSITEGDDGQQALIFDVKLVLAPSTPTAVEFSTRNLSAVAGVDYSGASGTLEFDAIGETRQISVLINGDRDVEADEDFAIEFAVDTGRLGTTSAPRGRILSDDRGVGVSNRELVVRTGGVDDTITLMESAGSLRVNVNGVDTAFDSGDVDSLRFLDDGGDNSFIVDRTVALPVFVRTASGNDTVQTGGGHDLIHTGGGNDHVWSGTGNDSVFTSSGNDTVFSGAGNDLLDSGTGADELHAGAGADYLDAGGGRDQARAGTGIDTVLGRGGNDWLRGKRGMDVVAGGTGADNVGGGAGDDLLLGSDIYRPGSREPNLELGDRADTIRGGVGHDDVHGGLGADVILGGAGRDTITSEGRATIEAGEDDDRVFLPSGGVIDAQAGDDVVEVGSWQEPSGPSTVHGGAGRDRITAVGLARVSIFGQAGRDTLRGSSGGDMLSGGQDDDSIVGGDGNDVILGGSGHDELIGGSGHDLIRGGNDDDAIEGSDGRDTLRGDAGADILTGGDGSDVVLGGVGNDVITGDDARNILVGGAGADDVRGGLGEDIVIAGVVSMPDTAFGQILKEWRSSRGFLARVQNIRDGSGSTNRDNGEAFLAAGNTVADDGVADPVVTGSFARTPDWLFGRPEIDSLFVDGSDILDVI